LAEYISLAGGLPVTADPRRATLDRIQQGSDQPRSIQDISLSGAGQQTQVKNGDVLTVMAVVPELSNAITLRGAVAQPGRQAWKLGMRVSDVIHKKSLLITPETVRKQNEVLFDSFEQERSARGRARVPYDLAVDRVLLERQKKEEERLQASQMGQVFNKAPEPVIQLGVDPSKATFAEQTEREIAIAILGKPALSEENLTDKVGNANEAVNLDYAVIERYSRETLKVSLLPFNLGKSLTNPKGQDDLVLEPGDVITVFSNKDIQIPKARRQAFVRIEGEVNSPGIYTLGPTDNLQTLIDKAGGTTAEAYLFAMSLYREDVKKNQTRNMEKLLRKMESESTASISQIVQSSGGGADLGSLQNKIQSLQTAQKQSLERFRSLKPEGRISLNLAQRADISKSDVPPIRLENGDRIQIPPRPDFIQIFGSVNTESALVFSLGLKVKDYLGMAGTNTSADLNGIILVRADGSAMTNQSYWGNDVLSATVLPGDTIVLPEKFDRESAWSQSVRTAKDFTQVLYQLGLGAAAIKTLRQ
jgi:protein involved in polysaccharide export with SLBB domain